MSGLVAVLERGGGAVDGDALRRATLAVRPQMADRRSTVEAGPAGLGAVMFDTTPEAAFERLPLRAGPFTLASDARIDNRADLRGRLSRTLGGLGLGEGRPVTDADLVLASYAEWGSRCPEHLVGDFAFAVWDARRGVLFVARDHLGVRPLYTAVSPRRVVVATEPAGLFAYGVPRAVDRAEFAAVLREGDTTTADVTVFEGVRLLPNAHAAEYGPGAEREWAYHALQPAAPPVGEGDVVDAFRELFVDAVRARSRCASGVSVQLSGGLDSSAVACVARDAAAERGGGAVPAYALYFDESPASDEREYVRSVAETGGFDLHVIRADALSPLGNLAEYYGLVGDGPVTGTHHLVWAMYKAAGAGGHRVMLDGVDGDIVVEHGERRLLELARARDWRGFFHEAKLLGEYYGADPRSAGLKSIESSFAEGPRYLFSIYGLQALDEAAADSPVEFARSLYGAVKHGQARPAAVLRRVRRRLLVPKALLRRLRPDAVARAPGLRERQAEKLTDPGLSRSLGLMTHAAAAFGVEVAHPFMDVRLVEFCLGLPSEYSLQDGETRRVLRRALAGTLPDAVTHRAAKSTMTPAFERALFETDRQRLRGLADLAERLPADLRPPPIEAFGDEVERAIRAHDAGADVRGERGAMLAARASGLYWAGVLGLDQGSPHP